MTDPKDPANTDWLFIETPKYLSETDLLNNNGGASVGRGNQHDGNVTLPLIPSERGSVSNGPQSRKKSITVQMTASSSNGAGGIIEFPVIRAPTISSEEEAKAKEHSANKMAARRPSILPQQMESQIMLAGGGTSRRKQELTPSQKYSTFRTSQQALSKSIGSKSMSKTRDEAMKQSMLGFPPFGLNTKNTYHIYILSTTLSLSLSHIRSQIDYNTTSRMGH